MEELLYYDAVSSSSYSGTCSSFSSSDLADDSTVFSSYSDFKPLLDFNKPELPYTPPFEDSLSCDILKLFEGLLLSRESFESRQQLVSSIQKMLQKEWPEQQINVHLFGSSVNDLGTDSSDVDICITTPFPGLHCIKTLASVLQKNGLQIIRTIPNAKVPIVKVWDPKLQLACDLNVNNTLALQNSKLIKAYVSIDPRVRPLAMVIKYWAKRRGINDAGDGGTLSTYTWICMLISFLQTREPPILPNLHETAHTLSKDNLVIHGLNSSFCCDNMEGFGSDNHETLGGLLYAFFRKFGYEFDYDHQVVSIRSKCLVSKRENWRDDRLCIEEPFDVHRNLGNSVDEASLKGLQLELQRAVNLILENNDLNTVCNLFQPPLHPHHNHYTSNNHSTSSIPINNTFAKKPPCYIYYADPTNYFPIYYLPNRPSKRHYNYKMKSGRDSKVKH